MTHQILLQRIILDKHATELLRIEKKSHKHTRDAPFYGLEATATASSRQITILQKIIIVINISHKIVQNCANPAPGPD